MSDLTIHMFPCLADNYGYLLHDADSGVTAAVDTPDADEILAQLDAKGLAAHAHSEHASPRRSRRRQPRAQAARPAARSSARARTRRASPASTLPWARATSSSSARIAPPCSTRRATRAATSSITSRMRARRSSATRCSPWGAAGCSKARRRRCGARSQKILRWPDDTRIYCAHEYTQSNARFALTVEPQNQALRCARRAIAKLRAVGKPTVPSTLGEERATNPFLRPRAATCARRSGCLRAADVDVFAKTRALKDAF